MKKINIFLLFLTALFFSGCFQNSPQIIGFRDMKWGDGVERLYDYTVIANNQSSKVITAVKNDEMLKIGDANISTVEYYFFDNALYAVNVRYKDAANNNIIMQAVETKYGLDYKQDKVYSKYKDGYVIKDNKITENIRYSTAPNPNSPATWDVKIKDVSIFGICDYYYVCRMELVSAKILKNAAEYAKKIREAKKKQDNEKLKDAAKVL